MSCQTGQTGYDVNRTKRGPLNPHRDYPLSFPRGCQQPHSRDHPRVFLHTCPIHQPDHNSNPTGQLILSQREQGRGFISISQVTETRLRDTAQARRAGQAYTGRTDITGATEGTIESKYSKRTTNHHQLGRNTRVPYIRPEDGEKLTTLLKRHREDKEWLGKQGGAILRRILHMLREQGREQQTDYMDDCLRSLTMGHQYATAAWIWQSIGLSRDLERKWTTERKQESTGLAQYCRTQWTQVMHRRSGVLEYLNKHSGTNVRTLVGQLRESQNRL